MTYIPFFRKRFEELKKKYPEHKPLICIDGMSGTGKSMFALFLKDELNRIGVNLTIKNSGDFFREFAKNMGYDNLDEFSKARQENEELAKKTDIILDEKTLEYGIKNGGILVGRITIGLLGDEADVRIFIIADVDKIAERVAGDPKREEYGKSIEEIKRRIIRRNEYDTMLYEKIYNIKYNEVETTNSLLIVNNGSKDELKRKAREIVKLIKGTL